MMILIILLLLAWKQEQIFLEALITYTMTLLAKLGMDWTDLFRFMGSHGGGGSRVQRWKILYYIFYSACGLGVFGEWSVLAACLVSAFLIAFLMAVRYAFSVLGKKAEEDADFREKLREVFEKP